MATGLILAVFYQFSLWAQSIDVPPQDLSRASSAGRVQYAMQKSPDACYDEEILSTPTARIGVATVRPPKIDKKLQLFKVHVSSPDEIPKEIREAVAGEAFERAQDGEYEIVVALPNDNAGLGFWTLLSGKNDGDDDGPTHGMQFTVGKGTQAGYWQMDGESNIYTKTIQRTRNADGSITKHALFTEENALRFIFDNMKKGNAMFWEAGVGWRELNHRKPRSYLSAWQMEKYHDLLVATGSDLADRVVFVPSPDRGHEKGWEAHVGLGAVRDTLLHGGRVRIESIGQVSLHGGQLDSSNFVSGKGEVNLYHQKNPDGVAFKLGGGIETARGPRINETYAHVDMGVARNNGSLVIKAKRGVMGNEGQENVVAPADSDTIWVMEFKCKFSQRQRCRPFQGLFMGKMGD